MAKGSTSLTEVREVTWTESVGSSLVGITLLLAGAIIIYFTKYIHEANMRLLARVACGIGMFAGAAILGVAIQRSIEAKKTKGVPFTCPYCDTDSYFLEKQTEDFDCEHCHRKVQFVEGEPVPVRTIICQACKTEHRVPVNLARYVCDKCNRPLKVAADITQKIAAASNEAADAMLQNYNVVLLGIDRRQENELAFKVQSLMMLTLPEAKRLLEAASPNAPLIVASDLPQRKADAVRRSLQELGGTAALRAAGTPAPGVRK